MDTSCFIQIVRIFAGFRTKCMASVQRGEWFGCCGTRSETACGPGVTGEINLEITASSWCIITMYLGRQDLSDWI